MPSLDTDQLYAVKWILKSLTKHKGVILADRMGKGKTAPAIQVLAEALKMNRPGLIICPAFLLYNWQIELEKWGVNETICIIESTKQVLTDARIYLVSYDTATAPQYKIVKHRNGETTQKEIPGIITRQLLKKKLSIIICDEAHYLKSWNSKRSKYILGTKKNKKNHLRGACHRMTLLTGTPILNNVEELFNVVTRISTVLSAYTREEFIFKFAAHIELTPWGLKHRGVKNENELRRLLAGVMLSRQNIDGLTERSDEYIRFKLSGTALINYINQEEIFLRSHGIDTNEIEQLQKLSKFEAAQLAAIRQAIGVLKVPLYMEALGDVLDRDETIVIFCYYRKTQEILQAEIEKRFKQKMIIINGDVEKKKRFDIVQDFQAGKIKILLATIGALREGVNLTACHNVDFVEFDWTPANMEQAIARCHRRGQESAVSVRYFAFDGGIDKYMLRVLEQKKLTIKKIMVDKNNVLLA